MHAVWGDPYRNFGCGLPFDVLLNKDSKRKIHSSVAWKDGERLFGQDAYNLVRFLLVAPSERAPLY